MLDFLKDSTQLTSFSINVNSIDQESLYKNAFNTYVKEIPPDFLSFYNTKYKRQKVGEHLKKIYNLSTINSFEIECVLRRVINLARVVTSSHRSDYEDKLAQNEFKKNNWSKIERCQICGYQFKSWTDSNLEHVLPLSLGGDDSPINWQLLCRQCNNEKSSLFGINSINRTIVFSDIKIFQYNTTETQLSNIPKNYRYLVIERDQRSCSLCTNTHKDKKLYVTIKNKDEIVNYDNLYTICEVCARIEKIPKRELI